MNFRIPHHRLALLGSALIIGLGACSDSVTSPAALDTPTLSATQLEVGEHVYPAAMFADNATGSAEDAGSYRVVSSNPRVAAIQDDGTIVTVDTGVAAITLTKGSFQATAPLMVTLASTTAPTVSVTIDSSSVAIGGSARATAVVRDGTGKELKGRTVTWSSSAPTIATVTSGGGVGGQAAGVAAISATYRTSSGSANITVRAAVTVATTAPAPVQTVAVAMQPASITVGQASTAAVTLKDAAGNVLTGRSITYATSNASVASVSASGVATGVAAGTATITATSEGQSGTATLTVANATQAATTLDPTAEPAYSAATQKLLFTDDFDSYTSFASATANGWRGTNRLTTPDYSTNPAGANQIVAPGYDGTGKALRLVYDGIDNGAGQEAHSWSREIGDPLAGAPGHTFYMSYYFRITPGRGTLDQDASHLVKVKWLELWNATDGDRAQFNTSYSQCVNDVPFAGASGTGTLFQFYGSAGGNTSCQAGQVRGPFAYQGAGQWHRATHRYVTRSSATARDGVAQMWVDGTLVVSVREADCGVAVPGGVGGQPWCTTADLDAMFVQNYARDFTLGSVQTAALWPFTLDYDHMVLWRDP